MSNWKRIVCWLRMNLHCSLGMFKGCRTVTCIEYIVIGKFHIPIKYLGMWCTCGKEFYDHQKRKG